MTQMTAKVRTLVTHTVDAAQKNLHTAEDEAQKAVHSIKEQVQRSQVDARKLLEEWVATLNEALKKGDELRRDVMDRLGLVAQDEITSLRQQLDDVKKNLEVLQESLGELGKKVHADVRREVKTIADDVKKLRQELGRKKEG
ncbi:MAG: hypothetical protein AMXMBFR64_53760 [Myxococcales bacterium]